MKNRHFNTIEKVAFLIVLITCLFIGKIYSQIELSTDYLKLRIDKRGFITSLKNSTKAPNREFSPADKPSPLLCLYNSNKKIYYEPKKAIYVKAKKTLILYYGNGSVATGKMETKAKYFKLTLESLTHRK